MFDLGYWLPPPNPQPDRITGTGRMRVRGRDKTPADMGKKRKAARKLTKQSRRRNRK